QGADGKGWVTAQYITTAGKPEVPTIGGNQADPDNANVAVVQQQLNVRSGPGTGFNSLGTLNAQDVVSLTGKDPNGAWLQIDFPQGAGPEGKGWVNAAFVQAQGAENLPIITEAGLIVGTGTPTGIPFTPTVTLLPAMDDGDSAQSPAINVTFSAAGTHDLQYSSDISSPDGDAEDWVQFTPYQENILLELSCKGGNLDLELLQSGQVILQLTSQDCANQQIVPVQPGKVVQVHLSAIPNESRNYSLYTLNIKTLP
ncbi:MAG: SH3 domain-containing protein, partial [Chloroflexi bacterium]